MKVSKRVRNKVTCIFFALIFISLPIQMPYADSLIDLPSPLKKDEDLINYYWQWLIKEIDAPNNIQSPKILIDVLPKNKLMGLFFPTMEEPNNQLTIIISKDQIEYAKSGNELTVLGNLAHEIVHYIKLLKDNDWNHNSKVFFGWPHDHCNLEYQRLVNYISVIIWNAYHSNVAVRNITQMVRRSCWERGESLNQKNYKRSSKF